MTPIAIPTMESVTAKKVIVAINAKVYARQTVMAKVALNFVGAQTEESVTTFLANVIAQRDSLAHCKLNIFVPSTYIIISFFFCIDVKRVAKAEKTKTNANHHVVVRMVEFAMRKRSNVTVHQDGSVKYAPTGASQDVTD